MPVGSPSPGLRYWKPCPGEGEAVGELPSVVIWGKILNASTGKRTNMIEKNEEMERLRKNLC
jgi:hypothetical protein